MTSAVCIVCGNTAELYPSGEFVPHAVSLRARVEFCVCSEKPATGPEIAAALRHRIADLRVKAADFRRLACKVRVEAATYDRSAESVEVEVARLELALGKSRGS